jgi:hypothetical protein
MIIGNARRQSSSQDLKYRERRKGVKRDRGTQNRRGIKDKESKGGRMRH